MEGMDQVVAELKAIGLKHGKAAMMDVAVVVLPLCLDALKKAIPGQIDDAMIEIAKPIAQDELKKLIAKLGA